MTLIVTELMNGVVFEQPFRIKKSISVAHIRPWIYKHQLPTSGVLTLEVWQEDRLLAKSTIDHSVIAENIQGTYAHGQIRFDFTGLQLNHNPKSAYSFYTLKLYNDGYSNSTSFIGAVRRYEDLFYGAYGEVTNGGHGSGPTDPGKPINDTISPLGFEVFDFKFLR